MMLVFAICVAADCVNVHGSEVRVTLRAENVSDASLIRIGDVADVESDNAFYARKVRELDLMQLADEDRLEPLKVSRKLVETRVAFADLEEVRVNIGGSTVALVRFALHQEIDQQFVDAITEALADQLQVGVADVQVELVESIDLKAFLASGAEVPDLVPRMPQPPRLGRLRVPVEMKRGTERVRALNVSVDAKWNTNCILAKTDIVTGDVIPAEAVQVERRWIDRIDHHAELEQIVGMKSKRSFRTGDPVRPEDVHRSTAEAPYLVNPRDVVRIVAQRGPLRVIVVDGEVLQRGRKGEMVRVRNPNSKAVVTAQVVDRNEVLIPLR